MGAAMRAIKTKRTAITLLEMMAVVILIGIFAAVAIMRLGPGVLPSFAGKADARRLALDLQLAQRRAISTGIKHYIKLESVGSKYTGYTLYQRASSSGSADIAVDSFREFATTDTISSSHAQFEFSFDGTALAAYELKIASSNQVSKVSVVPMTGAVQLTQGTP